MCSKKRQKSPNQETGLGNKGPLWGPLEALNGTKLILHDLKEVTHVHLGPILCHSKPSDVPYCPNQFLGWDFFVTVSYSKPALAFEGSLDKKV